MLCDGGYLDANPTATELCRELGKIGVARDQNDYVGLTLTRMAAAAGDRQYPMSPSGDRLSGVDTNPKGGGHDST
jgi:hypothetical protein